MAARIRFLFLIAAVYLIQMVLLATVAREKVYYMDFEHLKMTYWNPKYVTNINVTCRRFGRKDPVHYVHIHVENLVPFGNNVKLDYYLYEFLSNEYRRSFVEFHFGLCDLFFHDQVFGPHINMALPKTCPIPTAMYHLENLSLVDVPLLRTFPFQKGRMYLNVTIGIGGKRERIAELYADAAIKQKWR